MADEEHMEKSEHEEAQSSARGIARFWEKELTRAIRRNRDWWERGDEVISAYRGEHGSGWERFNILWANTEVLKPAVYSHIPVPEVHRRYLENDPVGEAMAMVMERTLTTCLENPGNDFDRAAEKVRDDMLLPGRGVMRVFYSADFETRVEPNIVTDPETGEVVQDNIEYDDKIGEEAYVKYYYWKDFLTSDGNQWDEVWWVAFARNMTRHDLVNEFGDRGAAIPLCGRVLGKSEYYDEDGDFDYSKTIGGTNTKEPFARVWEIWDSRTREVIVIAEGYDKPIDAFDDPYELDDFFPTPEPLYSFTTTGSLEPIPEFAQYQYQAEELNILTRRISRLTEGLKARGVGDADIKSLQELFSGEDNEIILDEEFSKLMQAGGVGNAVSWAPIKEIADVLAVLQPRRRETLNLIYELTGISDIMRGQSDPRETATAIVKKGQYGSSRIRDRQKRFQRYCRDVIRILGELVGNLFDPETFIIASGVQNNQAIMEGMQEVYKKMSNKGMRDYTIDIQTDSTIAINEQDRQEEAIKFFTAVGTLMKEMFPAIESGMIPPKVAKELMLYAARRFDAGRDLVGVLQQIGEQPPQGQGEAEGGGEEQAQAALQIAQLQAEIEREKIQQKREEAQMDYQMDQAKLQVDLAKIQQEAKSEDLDRQIEIAKEYIRQETVRINARGKGDSRAN